MLLLDGSLGIECRRRVVKWKRERKKEWKSNAWEYFTFLDSFPRTTRISIVWIMSFLFFFGTKFTCLKDFLLRKIIRMCFSSFTRRDQVKLRGERERLAGGLEYWEILLKSFPMPISLKACFFILLLLLLRKELNVVWNFEQEVADFWRLTWLSRYLDSKSKWNYQVIYDDVFILDSKLSRNDDDDVVRS